MKQLDVVVSPPAFLWDPYLTLTNVIFDLDICFYLVIFCPMNYFLVTDGRTDRRKGRIKAHRAWAQVGSKSHLNFFLSRMKRGFLIFSTSSTPSLLGMRSKVLGESAIFSPFKIGGREGGGLAAVWWKLKLKMALSHKTSIEMDTNPCSLFYSHQRVVFIHFTLTTGHSDSFPLNTLIHVSLKTI